MQKQQAQGMHVKRAPHWGATEGGTGGTFLHVFWKTFAKCHNYRFPNMLETLETTSARQNYNSSIFSKIADIVPISTWKHEMEFW